MSSPDPYESESEFDLLLRSEMQRTRGSPQGITPERIQEAFRDLLGPQYRSPTSVGVGTSDSNRLPDDDGQAAWDLLAQQALSDAITMPDDAFTDITVEEVLLLEQPQDPHLFHPRHNYKVPPEQDHLQHPQLNYKVFPLYQPLPQQGQEEEEPPRSPRPREQHPLPQPQVHEL